MQLNPAARWSLLPLALCAGVAAAAQPQACESLVGQRFGAAEILEARSKAAGSEFSIFGLYLGVPFNEVPASCRISGTVRPSADSDIHRTPERRLSGSISPALTKNTNSGERKNMYPTLRYIAEK